MKHYHKNPRQITEKQFKDLGRWLKQLGDLSGIVHNLETDEIIGGNQRARVFELLRGTQAIELVHVYDEPTPQGTVAEGFITWQGARYVYRQVRWDAETAELANLVANHAGGTWDWDILANEWDEETLFDAGFEEWELQYEQDTGSNSAQSDYQEIPGQWLIVIECSNEDEQTDLLTRFSEEGLTCRALIS